MVNRINKQVVTSLIVGLIFSMGIYSQVFVSFEPITKRVGAIAHVNSKKLIFLLTNDKQ